MPLQNKSILVIGSANIDLVVTTDRLPRAGETVMGGDLETFFGGKGANQAVAAARLGGVVAFAGMVGDDSHGQGYRQHLGSEGIDTGCLYTADGVPTGSATIIVDAQGANMIVVSPGANRFSTVDKMPGLSEAIARADIVVLQLEIPHETVVSILKTAKEQEKTTVLNPSPLPSEPGKLFESISCDYLIVNEVELATLSGADVADDAQALDAARRLVGKDATSVVVTRGGESTLFVDGDGHEFVPVEKVSPVDTVGAGDTFAGAFAVGIAEGVASSDAVRFANAAAAKSTLKKGAQTSMPTRAEL